ncbi:isoaspartyl peptidase/L-asparaginase-like [Tigriopus californicus]|uniref:isoaspartyl peptidase/L-asparaginase-like n=1 Tax=Tigriopus californicus TaxID=6832 RepID=UPI0027DA3CA2|nr:isoaspartyl peptidase/L-asparaginase-like [Tigriopus californicus]
MKPVIVVHGGAGEISDSRVQPKLDGMRKAVREGYRILQQNQILDADFPSVAAEAVTAAVRVLEDLEAFNAGYGSVLTEDGEVEMDAGIMEGKNLAYGAVGGIVKVKNAIDVAAKVMNKSEHCFFAGAGANRFAESQHVPEVSGESLKSPFAIRALERFRNSENITNEIDDADEAPIVGKKEGSRGTVGAVALDAHGHLAAATSTGGLTGKLVGRIGDTPVIGAGVYADNDSAAISTTGLGESFLRALVARRISEHVEKGEKSNVAIKRALDFMEQRVGGDGGAVLVTQSGDIGIEWNSTRMGWAYACNGRLHSGCNRHEDFDESI